MIRAANNQLQNQFIALLSLFSGLRDIHNRSHGHILAIAIALEAAHSVQISYSTASDKLEREYGY